jgi:hypothetical protein
MTVTRDQFREGYTWDEWLEVVGETHEAWRSRYEEARLGELRAEYQLVPGSRHVLCVVDEACTDSVGTVPYIAKACEQAGAAGGVELRIFSRREHPELLSQFQSQGRLATPVCVVFDDAWVQVGRWGPRPEAAERFIAHWRPDAAGDSLDEALDLWYSADEGRSTLREFLAVLRGQGVQPWRAGRRASQQLWNQAEQAGGEPERAM